MCMSRKRHKGRKVRVDFRQNRQQPRRSDDWTRRYHQDEDATVDERLAESVRAKGELSRRRTVIVDEDDVPVVDERLWQHGVVTAVHGLICRVDDKWGQHWDCTARRVLRTLLIEQRSSVTVGDRVWFSDHSKAREGEAVGVIERVAERTTTLSRRDRRQREHTIVANADQLLIVASIAEPALKPHLIDRYLVAAAKGDLRPVICFNKCDLEPEAVEFEEEPEPGPDRGAGRALSIDEIFEEFRALGYSCIRTSATERIGLEKLRRELAGHMTVLSGQSGVGKSSLLNALQPGLNLKVMEVSRDTEKGRHVTAHARLLRLDFGGYVVDTPGIRQFGLWNVEPGELEACFVEFVPRVQDCRFNDCHHVQEEGCAIVAAVEAGEISERRYFSYLKMLDEMAHEQRQ
jgi:ribosome biogenesis GTPase